MTEYISKIIKSNQVDVHDDLLKALKKYSFSNYARPIPNYTDENLQFIKDWLKDDDFIIDLGCGTGESSYFLGREDRKVLGIDRSMSRIHRKNEFKVSKDNVLIIRDNILDLIPLLYRDLKKQVLKVYLLYPNPYPKKSQYKTRFHASPIAPFLMNLCNDFTVRSNWKIYLKEFAASYNFYRQKKLDIFEINPKEYMSAFERKYHLSGQKLYELKTMMYI